MERVVKIRVYAEWDEDAKVWVARSNDIAGLATEADTVEALEAKLRNIIPELIEHNGINGDVPKHTQIPFLLHANKESCLSV